MEPSDYEKVELYAKFFLFSFFVVVVRLSRSVCLSVCLYAKFFAESNRRVAMRDFARLNVYVADGNVLQTDGTETYAGRVPLARGTRPVLAPARTPSSGSGRRRQRPSDRGAGGLQ